ncbi:hypothetical protein UlMin_035557 [Ulmus minor]
MDLSVVPYKHSTKAENESEDGDVVEPKLSEKALKLSPIVNYRECMRNHAASIGGHANDGCGEFMPRADDSLTCAACSCHRNFHRREILGGEAHHPGQLFSPGLLMYNAGPATPRWSHHRAPPARGNGCGREIGVEARENQEIDRRSETPEREKVQDQVQMGISLSSRGKRFRTKFTQEQKDRMLAFAEKIGWRIQRHDDVAINQFCSEIGVKRNVLKVWMHNNKSTLRRRESGASSPPQPAGV